MNRLLSIFSPTLQTTGILTALAIAIVLGSRSDGSQAGNTKPAAAEALQFAKGLSDADEPDLWQHDLTGQLVHWVEVGQPEDRRLAKACGRAERVSLFTYGPSVPIWWGGIENKLTRLSNLTVWQIPADQAQALAAMAQRSMQWQVTVQDGSIWVSDGQQSVELSPQALKTATR